MNPILEIILTGILFVVIDSIYLSSVSKYFNKQILSVQGNNLKLEPISAILCYIVLIFSIYYFIISRHARILDAMLLGWTIYLVYELTNKAIISKWSWRTVLLDGVWGGILYGLTTLIVYYISKRKIVF